MEPRHHQPNVQWYHETQSSSGTHAASVQNAAQTRDRFLLGLGIVDDEALNAALKLHAGVFSASLACYQALFPERIALSRDVTLSPYDRFSTALTVAQVTGIQPLCSHYAAHLAPLESPDASRHSNIRLAQITQYARQLASQPTLICAKALQQLSEVGLSVADIVTFSQIIGFVSYQARVVAGVAALAGRPATLVPGFPGVEDAQDVRFTIASINWRTRLPGIAVEQASQKQRETLAQCSEPYEQLLAHNAAALHERNQLFSQVVTNRYDLPPRLKALAALTVSRINGSRYCTAKLAQDVEDKALVRRLFSSVDHTLKETKDPLLAAIIRVSADLARTPEKFTPHSIRPLFSQGLSQNQVLNVILTGALYAWENRLRSSLGDTVAL